MKIDLKDPATWPTEGATIVVLHKGHPCLFEAGYVVGQPEVVGDVLVFDFCDGTDLLLGGMKNGMHWWPFAAEREVLDMVIENLVAEENNG